MQTITKNWIEKMYSQLQANNNVIPSSWIPWADLFLVLLEIASIFFGDVTRTKIKAIITILRLYIENRNKSL